MALASAAVLTVYAAGYARTKPAADRMATASNERRPAPPNVDTPPSDLPVTVGSATGAGNTAVAAQMPESPSAAKGPAARSPLKSSLNVADKPTEAKMSAAAASTPSASVSAPAATSVESHAAPAVVATPSAAVATPSAVAATASPAAPAPSTPASVPATAPSTTPATASPEAPAAPATTAKPIWRDGLFVGRGTSRHGDIEAMVEIKDGHIIGAVISQCLTRYSCSWINHLLPQIVARQSADVDYVSGATQSANALYWAVTQALAQAK